MLLSGRTLQIVVFIIAQTVKKSFHAEHLRWSLIFKIAHAAFRALGHGTIIN